MAIRLKLGPSPSGQGGARLVAGRRASAGEGARRACVRSFGRSHGEALGRALVVVAILALGSLSLCACSGPVFSGAPIDGGAAESRDSSVDATTLNEGGIFVRPPEADAGAGDGGCDGTEDPATSPCVVNGRFGVFVASNLPLDAGFTDGDPTQGTGDGSRANPFSRLSTALLHLGTKSRVYVCNGLYPEQVSVQSATSLYGGFSCAPDVDGGLMWSYVGGSAQVRSPHANYALTVSNMATGPVTIQDMTFVAPSTSQQDPAGSSSVAAFVTTSVVTLTRVRLIAGNGNDGAPGLDGAKNPNYVGPAPVGGPQVYSCDVSPCINVGGPGGINLCLQSGMSAGGDGGVGCDDGIGNPGAAVPFAVALQPGIDGQPRNAALPDGGVSAGDDPGADGLPGDGGVPAPPQSYGTVDSFGWLPRAGGNGDPGNPGQGGAGASDPLYPNACGAPTISFGGGGGGAGGCGGAGGQGGGGGGASIALVAFGGSVTLRECVLLSAAAGNGGAGGAGQDGQTGAPGGMFDPTGIGAHGANVAGKPGGNGAGGSGGAGGTGGISAGIVYRQTTLTHDDASFASITVGAPGAGGPSGLPGAMAVGALTGAGGNLGAPGSPGAAVPVLTLP